MFLSAPRSLPVGWRVQCEVPGHQLLGVTSTEPDLNTELELDTVDSSMFRCATYRTHKLFNRSKFSVSTNSLDIDWLVLECFPARLLPMASKVC